MDNGNGTKNLQNYKSSFDILSIEKVYEILCREHLRTHHTENTSTLAKWPLGRSDRQS